MGKSILYNLFGIGKLPKQFASDIRNEIVVLMDEGLGGSIILKNFRAPGRYSGWKRSWFTGCVVLTEQRFAAFAFGRPLINIPATAEYLNKLHYTAENSGTLHVSFDASAFHENRSGLIECRFKTPLAERFVAHLAQKSG